jgi:hypothetical protein
VPDTLVLGDPGYGKSWLLRATAARAVAAARAALPTGVQSVGVAAVDAAVLPVWVELDLLAEVLAHDPTRGLVDALVTTLLGGPADGAPAAYREWLTERLALGQITLLLDGLDEVRRDHVDTLRTALHTWIRTHRSQTGAPRIVLTSRPIEHARGILPPATTQTVELLPFDAAAAARFVDARFHEAAARDDVLSQLRHTALGGLAQIPLLLTLLCYIADRNRDPVGGVARLPTRRAALYDRVLTEFLTIKNPDPSDVLDPDEQRAVLEQVALTMTSTAYGDWITRLTRDELAAAIGAALDPVHRPDISSVINQLTAPGRGVLITRGDALHPTGRTTYEFLHRTFHEYLVASALTHDPDRRHRLIAAHRWFDDEWHQVLLLLAGHHLPDAFDPDVYLAALAFPEDGCDPLFHGLFLAAEAAAEHPRASTSPTIDRIVDRLQDRCTAPQRPFAWAAADATRALCWQRQRRLPPTPTGRSPPRGHDLRPLHPRLPRRPSHRPLAQRQRAPQPRRAPVEPHVSHQDPAQPRLHRPDPVSRHPPRRASPAARRQRGVRKSPTPVGRPRRTRLQTRVQQL